MLQFGMETWVLAEDFINADVIRWSEGVFSNRRRGKALKIGERIVAAEVLSRGEDGWVRLLVRSCVVTRDDMAGSHVPVLKPESIIRRGLKTLLRGKVERLLWEHEDARAAIVASKPLKSQFLRDSDDR